MHIHIYIYICIYVHTYILIPRTHAPMYTCVHAFMHPWIQAYIYACMRAFIHTWPLLRVRLFGVFPEDFRNPPQMFLILCRPPTSHCYAQSPYSHFGFSRVWLQHNLDFEGWNSQAHGDFLGISPKSFTQAMLVGTMLVGGLDVKRCSGPRLELQQEVLHTCMIYIYIYICVIHTQFLVSQL